MTTKTDLTTGDIGQHIIRMSIPMIWGILAIISMNLADTWYVSQLGNDELAAMSFTFPVVMILTSLAFGIGTGASSVIARAIGAGKQQQVQSYSTQSLIIALFIAILFAVVGLFSIDPVFKIMGAPKELLVLIHQYMDTWYLGCFLVVVPMVGNAGIRAAGNTKLPGVVMITVAITNLVLDPIMIFGLLGFPAMGLQGAALATVISYSLAFVVAIYVLRVKLGFLCWQGCQHNIRQSWIDILRLAIPAAFTNLINPLSSALILWMIARYGSEAVAGFGIAVRIESFSLIALMAVSSALAPFAGQNWGAGKVDRLAAALKITYKFSWIAGLLIAALLWMSAETLASLFSDSQATIAVAVAFLRIVPLSFAFLGIIMMASNVANSVGDPLPSLWFSLTRLLVVFVPLAFLLSHWWGTNGIFFATSTANVLVGFAAYRWSMNKCRNKKRPTQLSIVY